MSAAGERHNVTTHTPEENRTMSPLLDDPTFALLSS